MKEIINLRERLKNEPLTLRVLEFLVQFALFDPSEKVRKLAIQKIDKIYEGVIKGALVGDCEVMVEIGGENEFKLGYLCDMPKDYFGEPIAHPFTID